MRFRRRVHFIYYAQNYVDLKPENVLIYIDDVESIIRSELANPNNAPKPSKFVGVPPSRGRGGNQTPRSESIFITGSQPLPSPSSSYGSSPGIDRWGFAMTKLDDQAVKVMLICTGQRPRLTMACHLVRQRRELNTWRQLSH